MDTSKAEIINEAIRRLQQLVEQMKLNPKVVDYFQQGKIYYSYITGGVIGSIDNISYDPRYEQAVHNFESKHDGYIVFHAIETGQMLSLLYVSNNAEDWPSEILSGNCIASYTINFEHGIEEFGDICISGYMKSGALVRIIGSVETNNETQTVVKPQKKHMVDFINQYCRMDGKRIPKYALNKLDISQLKLLIDSDPSLKDSFGEYLHSLSNHTQDVTSINKTDNSNAANDFREAVTQLLADNTSLLAILKFDEALGKLPKGTIPDKELLEIIDKFNDEKNVWASLKLIKYVTK